MDNISLSVGTVSVQNISKNDSKPVSHPNDVQFQVKYAEGYKGVKHMPEGIVTISKELADQFTKAGIGTVVEQTKPADDAGSDVKNDDVSKTKSSKPKDKK